MKRSDSKILPQIQKDKPNKKDNDKSNQKPHQKDYIHHQDMDLCQPTFNGRNLTNHVLYQIKDSHGIIKKKQKKIIYYTPGYMRLKIKNFVQLEFEDLSASINVVIQFMVNLINIPSIIQEQIIQKIMFRFNADEALRLFTQDQTQTHDVICTKVDNKGIYIFMIRKILNASMSAKNMRLVWTPFQYIKLILSVKVQSVVITEKRVREIKNQVMQNIKQLNQEIRNKINQLQIKDQKFTKQQKQMLQKQIAELKKLVLQIQINQKNAKIREQMRQKLIDRIQILRRHLDDYIALLDRDKNQCKDNEEQLNKIQQIQDIFQNLKNDLEDIESLIIACKLKEQELRKLLEFIHITVHFNLMDYPKEVKKNSIEYSSSTNFGSYDLAEKQLEAEFNNWANYKQKPEFKDFSEKHPFCFAHFVLPIYKQPFVGLVTIFVPLWLLGILGLGIFLQEPGLGDRLNSLATLMIAFIAFIPTVRQQLPPTPQITFVQYLLYMMNLIILLCFAQSLRIAQEEENNIVPMENGFFVVCLLIIILQVITITTMSIIFYFIKKRSYKNSKYEPVVWKFDHKRWENIECDKHFRNKYQCHKIKFLSS